MSVTSIEFNTGGLYYGWTSEELAQVDLQATREKIAGILATMFPGAEIEIKDEDGNDKIFGVWEHPSEKEDAQREISDYEWSDAQRWAVFK